MDFNSKEEADAALMRDGFDNRETFDAHTRFYQRQFPGEIEVGGISPGVEALFQEASVANKQAIPGQQGEAPAELPPEIQSTIREVDSSLRSEWGANYQQNVETAKSAALDLFGSVEAIETFAEKSGIDRNPALQARAVKLLAELGRGKR